MFGIDPRELEALELDEQEHRGDRRRDLGAGEGELRGEGADWSARELLRRVERDIMLQIVDAQWKDHLYSLDHLKEGIGLRGYGQRDPLVEYKKESFALFQDMKARIEEEIVRYLFWLRPVLNEGPDGEGAGAVRRPRRPAPAPRRRGAVTLNNPARGADRPRLPAAARRGRRAGAPQPARTGGDDVDQDRAARRAEGGPQRSVPVRQRQEVQEVPRSSRVKEQRPTNVGLLRTV